MVAIKNHDLATHPIKERRTSSASANHKSGSATFVALDGSDSPDSFDNAFSRPQIENRKSKSANRCGRSLILLLCSILACALLSGCAGYSLGPTNGLDPGEKSVQVMPFMNQTLEPRLTDEVTHQMRQALQRDGTYKLDSHGDGDIVLSGVIVSYTRHELSFQRTDTITPKDFRVTMTAQVIARERGTGKMLLDQRVTGYTLIRVGSDLVESERQALPLLAQDLAKKTAELLADGTF
jgi:hypothetical protein